MKRMPPIVQDDLDFCDDDQFDKACLAYRFIQLCNNNMGTRGFPNGIGGIETREEQLHPVQEGAFRLACSFLGRYFSATEENPEADEEVNPSNVRGADGERGKGRSL